MNASTIRTICILLLNFFCLMAHSQQITGVWKGRINGKKVEVKFVQKGDSLAGTSYYYESSNNYKRYSIKGYFDQQNNSVVWWDDQLIKDKNVNGRNPLLSVADFNCPGGGEMRLDGKASTKEDREEVKGPVSLVKVNGPSFPDEWDFVIDNYLVGGNDPDLIDSIALIAVAHKPKAEPPVEPRPEPPVVASTPSIPKEESKPVFIPKEPDHPLAARPQTVEEKFTSRKKVFMKEIPVTGDSIELRFYDNAQIDGDSISLFLNNQMIFTHVRLSDKAYSVKLSVKELSDNSELVMVAENLGSIPPNTSLMVAIVGDKRYDAQLASTENSSAMIKLKKAISH